MKKKVLGFSATALVLSLAACSGTQPENNLAADDLNAMANMEEPSPVEPAANVAGEVPVAEAPPKAPAATEPATAKPSPAKPKPESTTAKPAPEPPAEPKAPTPDCPPEHHAAGHC